MSKDEEELEFLEIFNENYSEKAVRVGVPEARLNALGARVPHELLEFWRSHGWCSYMNGLLRTVDPDDFIDVKRDWRLSDAAIVFGRSGFGDLLVISSGKLVTVYTHTGRISVSPVSYAASLALLGPEDAVELFFGALYHEAVEVHGVPTDSEMFTFEPALALGGKATLEYVRRVPMKPALSILAQLHDELVPY